MLITSQARTKYFGTGDPIAARIRSGDTFTLECSSFSEGFTLQTIETLQSELAFIAVTGPLWIEGALPGDTLKIDIKKLEIVRDFGCVVLLPGRGAFGDEISQFTMRGVPLDRSHAHFNKAIKIPLRPMLGMVGVAPAGEPVRCNVPGPHGGNMDNNHIREGASVYLPVFVDGAYFSAGDAHAVQGDGEIGLSAVECEMLATLRIEVLHNFQISRPLVVSDGLTMTVAEGATLDEAAAIALHDMARLLSEANELSLSEAVMLLSVAADVHVCQLVNPLVGVKVIVSSSLLPLPN